MNKLTAFFLGILCLCLSNIAQAATTADEFKRIFPNSTILDQAALAHLTIEKVTGAQVTLRYECSKQNSCGTFSDGRHGTKAIRLYCRSRHTTDDGTFQMEQATEFLLSFKDIVTPQISAYHDPDNRPAAARWAQMRDELKIKHDARAGVTRLTVTLLQPLAQ